MWCFSFCFGSSLETPTVNSVIWVWYLEQRHRDVNVFWNRPHHHTPVGVLDPRLPTVELHNRQQKSLLSELIQLFMRTILCFGPSAWRLNILTTPHLFQLLQSFYLRIKTSKVMVRTTCRFVLLFFCYWFHLGTHAPVSPGPHHPQLVWLPSETNKQKNSNDTFAHAQNEQQQQKPNHILFYFFIYFQ